MKAISSTNERRATNCGGPEETFKVERFLIEKDDVRTVHSNYLGYKRGKHVINESDVGRTIEEVSQGSSYMCWYFVKDTQ